MDKLNWKFHINNITYNLEAKPFVSQDYQRTAYFGLFKCHISYGLLIWGLSTHVHYVL